MQLNKLLSLLSILGFCQLVVAQPLAEQKCGHEYLQQIHSETHPEYAQEVATYLREELPRLQQNATARSEVVVTIPVVVHVIHEGTAIGSGSNVSVDRILSQIEILNEDYRRMNDDADETPTIFESSAADVEIEFCLAKVDPNGLPNGRDYPRSV